MELQTDENHFTILLAVFSEKLDNLFLHEEMQGATREPGHLPLRILSLFSSDMDQQMLNQLDSCGIV